MYLLLNNIFYDFIDICFRGMTSFIDNARVDTPLIIASIIYIIFSFYAIAFYLKKKNNSLLLISIFSVCAFFNNIPLLDYNHFESAHMFFIILLAYYLYEKYPSVDKSKKKIIKAGIYAFMFDLSLSILFLIVLLSVAYCDFNRDLPEEYKIYKYCFQIDSKVIQDLVRIQEQIDKYNQTSKVIILSHDSALITVPFNTNNNKFDLLNVGNLGSAGEQGIIDDIEKMHNVYFINNMQYEMYCYQESKIIFDYVANNLELVDTIENLNILADKNIYYKK